MSADLLLVIAVVAKGIKYLCQREVWQSAWHFLRCNAESPQLNDGAHRGTGAADNRLPTENLGVSYDIGMRRCLRYGCFLRTVSAPGGLLRQT